MTLPAGIHTVPADIYHADPCDRPSLSASIAKVLLDKSPKHAWIIHPKLGAQILEEKPERFDVGTAFHATFLQGENIMHEVEATDWRTKAAQEVRKLARQNGLIPLLSHEYNRVREMNAAVREQLADLHITPPMFTDGEAEQTLVWEEDGVLCRSRLDWLRNDHQAVDDVKTTVRTANPHEWTRTTLWNIGADIQVAFNIRGVRALTGRTPEFRYLVAECHPPYAVSVISLTPDAIALADQKVDRALQLWRECLDTGAWPAYPQQVCYAELPPWSAARWLEREALEEMGEEMVA